MLGITSSIDDCGARADSSFWVSLDVGAVRAWVITRGGHDHNNHRSKRRAHRIFLSRPVGDIKIRRSNTTFQGPTSIGLSPLLHLTLIHDRIYSTYKWLRPRPRESEGEQRSGQSNFLAAFRIGPKMSRSSVPTLLMRRRVSMSRICETMAAARLPSTTPAEM
jgi:hypothetical protein